MTLDQAIILDKLKEISARQEKIEKNLDAMMRLLIEGVQMKSGFSEEVAMLMLDIKDKRTLRGHAKTIKHKGTRFSPCAISKIRESILISKKRPHLKKIQFDG